jgi:hypothetical protein
MKSNLNIVNKEQLIILEKKCSHLIKLLNDISNICINDNPTLNVSLLRHDNGGFLLDVSKEEDKDLYMLLRSRVNRDLNKHIREIQELALTIFKENVH